MRAEVLLNEALGLLDEREYLVEAAFVQTALDRLQETIAIASTMHAPAARTDAGKGVTKLQ